MPYNRDIKNFHFFDTQGTLLVIFMFWRYESPKTFGTADLEKMAVRRKMFCLWFGIFGCAWVETLHLCSPSNRDKVC